MQEAELYLFTGPEIGEKNDAIKTIRENAAKKAGGQGALDEYSYYSSDVRVSDVISQLQNESLFSSSTFIVYRNAESIKSKDDIDLILSWAKASASSLNTLILVSDEIKVDSKLEKGVPSSHKRVFWEMFEDRKSQWLQSFFRKNGYSATDDALEMILELVENNTEALRTECSRFFFCFDKGHKITADDVDKVLAHNREESPFTLFQSLADSSKSQKERLESSLAILQKLLVTDNATGILSVLSYSFRQLKTWISIHSKSIPPTEAVLIQNGFKSKMIRPRYESAARCWNAGEVSSILSLISSTDMSIRNDGDAMSETKLDMMLYSMVMKKGLYCACYEK